MVETYDGVGIKEYFEYAQGLYQDTWEEVRQQGDRRLNTFLILLLPEGYWTHWVIAIKW